MSCAMPPITITYPSFCHSPVAVVVSYCTPLRITIIWLASDAASFDVDELFGANQFWGDSASATTEEGAILVLGGVHRGQADSQGC